MHPAWTLRPLGRTSLRIAADRSATGVYRGCARPGLRAHTVHWWRVDAFEADRLLRLRAEMRMPGRAWLQFEVAPTGGGSRITQTAVFDPLGLSGLLYWYGLYPLHWLIFRGMLRGIVRAGSPRSKVPDELSVW